MRRFAPISSWALSRSPHVSSQDHAHDRWPFCLKLGQWRSFPLLQWWPRCIWDTGLAIVGQWTTSTLSIGPTWDDMGWYGVMLLIPLQVSCHFSGSKLTIGPLLVDLRPFWPSYWNRLTATPSLTLEWVFHTQWRQVSSLSSEIVNIEGSYWVAPCSLDHSLMIFWWSENNAQL